MVSMLDELKERNILKLILIVRFACVTLDMGHPICHQPRRHSWTIFINVLISLFRPTLYWSTWGYRQIKQSVLLRSFGQVEICGCSFVPIRSYQMTGTDVNANWSLHHEKWKWWSLGSESLSQVTQQSSSPSGHAGATNRLLEIMGYTQTHGLYIYISLDTNKTYKVVQKFE
jgi:hypothetical protein